MTERGCASQSNDGSHNTGNSESDDQHLAANMLQKTLFLSLHITYQNFLFPVLTDGMKVVIFSAFANFVLSVLNMNGPLATLTATEYRGSDAADALGQIIFDEFMIVILTVINPIMFAVLLSFDHWGWNQGMFSTMSAMDDAKVYESLIGCAINCFGGLLSGVCYIYTLKMWLASNSLNIDPITMPKTGEEVDLSRYTVLRALHVAQQKINLTLGFDSHMPLNSYLPWKAEFMSPKLTDDEHHEQRGYLELVIMSLASVTTVVGVCMVMRHDGMDLKGWSSFVLDGADPPYPMCPMLGKCYQHVSASAEFICENITTRLCNFD